MSIFSQLRFGFIKAFFVSASADKREYCIPLGFCRWSFVQKVTILSCLFCDLLVVLRRLFELSAWKLKGLPALKYQDPIFHFAADLVMQLTSSFCDWIFVLGGKHLFFSLPPPIRILEQKLSFIAYLYRIFPKKCLHPLKFSAAILKKGKIHLWSLMPISSIHVAER